MTKKKEKLIIVMCLAEGEEGQIENEGEGKKGSRGGSNDKIDANPRVCVIAKPVDLATSNKRRFNG